MASDDPFTFGSTSGQSSPTSLLERARGRSLKSIWKQGVGAWLLTISTSAILGIQAIVELFLLTPVDIGIAVIQTSVESIILKPLGIVRTGADTTSGAVEGTSILGLPISVVVVLGTFFLVALYLRQRATSDSFVGSFTDFVGGTDEEGER